MKKSLFILTLFMLLKPVLLVVEYLVNYDYITKVLCVNKETPIMGCDGKCYLISQLAKSSDTEKPFSDKKIIVKELEVLFFQEITAVIFPNASFLPIRVLNFNYSNLYNYLNSTTTFHPPSIIL
ncbi:hypothetical protein VT569_10545 [Flavobacterium psychrophilum]|uniref:hypothetical protein n=1 Tax=Flavobacterium psychrophilum TaxID=96345 RepID=UPI003B42A5FD